MVALLRIFPLRKKNFRKATSAISPRNSQNEKTLMHELIFSVGLADSQNLALPA
jgi:hypothetical protein